MELDQLTNNFKKQFMVIAFADSMVCLSTILGFRPGEAFMIRNVANLVPPLENGPSETNAALEFAVKTLKVENILIIGHSCCGGIQTLMSMKDNGDSRTEAAANHLSFVQQCRICEKESINRSLLNLLTYPWIKDRVRKELFFICLCSYALYLSLSMVFCQVCCVYLPCIRRYFFPSVSVKAIFTCFYICLGAILSILVLCSHSKSAYKLCH
ncbi:hypothetical protein REPUB_Repub13aG0075200 [Reevesia pubescens]